MIVVVNREPAAGRRLTAGLWSLRAKAGRAESGRTGGSLIAAPSNG